MLPLSTSLLIIFFFFSSISSHLDPKEETTYEGKVDTWSAVYKKLTGKDVSFLFPH